MRTNRLALALLTLCSLAAPATAQIRARHPFGADDWAALHSASAVDVSRDGSAILYAVSVGGQKGTSTIEWRTISPTGSEQRLLKLPEHFTPAGFTHDGALYGLFQINGLEQFVVFPFKDGAVGEVPSTTVMLPAGVRKAVPSPDGSRFALLASPKPADPFADAHAVIEPSQQSIYVVDRNGSGGRWWCPSLNYVGDGFSNTGYAQSLPIAWSRDGSSLAVLSQTPKIGFHSVRSFIDVCANDNARRVAEISNYAMGVTWTDEGRTVAFLSTTTSVLTPDHVWTVPAAGGVPVDRTPDLKGSAIEMGSDGVGNVWVMVVRGVRNEVARLVNGTLESTDQWSDGVIQGLPAASPYRDAMPRVAFTVGDSTHASNVAVASDSGLKKITTEGDDVLATTELGDVRVVSWTSAEGIPLEGIVTFPAGHRSGQRYPFLVFPHGGPEANDPLALDAFARIIAGLGYVVMQPQYRGSIGYGSAFLDAIYQHFGDRAYRDVESATDFAIAQGWADANRLAIFGWSAGGFMTSWTITQASRYRAAIEGAGITEWASFIWTSDIQQFDYDADWPEKDIAQFQRFSPMMQIDKVMTPLLILHGDGDARVPFYQGRQFFEALSARGKTVRMVSYPGSGHFPAKWEQRRDIVRELVAWLTRYNVTAPSAG